MAIYHFSTQVIGRSAGRSSVAAAAYRAGQRLLDRRTGLVHDYDRKWGAESWIEAPEGAPAWAREREELWNQVEAGERRRDAQLCREIDVALPLELSEGRQRELLRGFVREQFVGRGMVADVALHRNDPGNPHAHVMLTMRRIGSEGEGFGEKERGWNDRALLGRWREEWARQANRELEREGSHERIDHRSHAARGIDREPTEHEGPNVREMEARGIFTERGAYNRGVLARNEERRHRSRGTPRGENREINRNDNPTAPREPSQTLPRRGARERERDEGRDHGPERDPF